MRRSFGRLDLSRGATMVAHELGGARGGAVGALLRFGESEEKRTRTEGEQGRYGGHKGRPG